MTLALCLAGGGAQAQRCLPRMHGIQVTGGLVDGKTGGKAGEVGGLVNGYDFYGGLALTRYARNCDKWSFGAEYLQRGYRYDTGMIPLAQLTADGGYLKCLLSDSGKNFFLSAGPSAMIGYESSNWGRKLLSDGATLRCADGFIYGLAATLEGEAYLSDRLVLLVQLRERCLWGTTAPCLHTQVGVGIRFMID